LALVYYLVLPLLYLIAYMPFWLMYRLSDFLAWLLGTVFKYRKDVIEGNLKRSFPDKSEQEIRAIRKEFYEFFFDLVLETLKTLTISKETMMNRVTMNSDAFKKHYANQQSVIVAMGHYGNWEWGGIRYGAEDLQKLFVIYHPLTNKYFNNLIIHMRTRLGNGLYSMKDSIRSIIGARKELTATDYIRNYG